ncbi:MAG: hypothetical protein WC793_03455 [Candidatus Paceibacterota bacterium]
MKEDIKKFIEQDEIDMSKFSANSEIMRNGTKEIYQATAILHSGDDISDNATKTIYWMTSILNQPLGYPVWFMTAYPDVVKWFSDLGEEKITSIVGDLTQDSADEKGYLKLSVLRKIVDAYKTDYYLECI